MAPRLATLALGFAACHAPERPPKQIPYPTTAVDWHPSPTSLCGLDTAPDAVIEGPWTDSWMTPLAATDLNGDGLADLVVSLHDEDDFLTSGFQVYLGTPDGLDPEPWIDFWGGDRVQTGADGVAVGDLDGDGFDDLAIATLTFETEPWPGSVAIWSGGTSAPTEPRWTPPGGPALAGIDANGDGLGDLLIQGPDPDSVSLYLGHAGTGPSATPDLVVPGTRDFGAGLWAAGDLDGDGSEDAVATDAHGDLWILPGGGLQGAPYRIPEPKRGLLSLTAADVDGDGLGDLVGGYWSGDDHTFVGWWPGRAGGLAPDPAVVLPGGDTQRGETANLGDLDGDGDDDLVLGARAAVEDGVEYAGEVTVHPGGPDGLDPTASDTIRAAGSRCFFGEVLVTADFDGDGLRDVATRLATDTENGPASDAVVLIHASPGWIP